jgi:hypothetical protein
LFLLIFQVLIVVEALKNLCGISWLKASEMHDNYNIRKLQAEIAEKSATKNPSHHEVIPVQSSTSSLEV